MTHFQEMADVLEKAVDNVRAGWTQNKLFENVDGIQYCCASGAIWLACDLSADEADCQLFGPRYELWYRTYKQLSQFVGDDLPAWNDSIGQTQERVADAMLHLAKELRNEPS